jgi:hypothetical protein
MPDEKWLWDQPKSWHAMNRALHDIGVLLDYLNELPDSRLLGYFKATQDRVSELGARNTLPPCDSYPEFLDRLDAIAAAFQTGCKPTEHAGQPGAVAFIDWSRDFLAAAAAPATASSIRLTRLYGIYRARGAFAWLGRPFVWLFRTVRRPARDAPTFPLLPPDPEAHIHERFARRLGSWVKWFEWCTVVMVLFTLTVSIYALSGRLILTNEKQTSEAWASLDAQVEAQEDKTFQAPKLPLEQNVEFHVRPLCDLVRSNKPIQVAATGSVPLPDNAGTPDSGGKFITARQEHLCDQREKMLQSLFIVTMHLQFWSSVIAGPHEDLLRHGAWRVRNPLQPAVLFGVSEHTLNQYAQERESQSCSVLAPPPAGTKYKPEECAEVLWTYIDRSKNVAESILGSITQYVLPVCYGLLGAMAAALRLIRRKVDAATLVPTDRARLHQGAILGVLCGAVIGLFANQVGGAENAGGLGLSALALIAGYNVDGVFRFLDELSDRIFGAAAKAK